MIVIELKEFAQNKGIRTAYQFQKLTGFAPAMAARLFNGKWTRLDLATLNTICNLLECTPNDILKFTPDKME